MRLKITASKNARSFYVIESYRKDGKNTSRVVERLGTEKALKEKLGEDVDVEQWARDHVSKLNDALKNNKRVPASLGVYFNDEYTDDHNRSLNVGYFILQQVLYQLGFKKMIRAIARRHRFTFNFEQVLAHLIYTRILSPDSKRASFGFCQDHLFEEPDYELHHIYRTLDVIEQESDFIQSFLYKSSMMVEKRNTSILYYDCTNFYFEISYPDALRAFGHSKENRPNPIVGLGMFLDGNGLPLAFDIYPGNQNEQLTLQPLEKRIIRDFELNGAQDMIVCSDAGLASDNNRAFNSQLNRKFIVIQPVKQMGADDLKWVLDPGRSLRLNPLAPGENPRKVINEIRQNGWRCDDFPDMVLSLDDIDEDDPANYNRVFYKERLWVKEDKKKLVKEQRLIVTYSIKYKHFMERRRASEIERAERLIKSKQNRKIDAACSSDVTRLIKSVHTTASGEAADKVSREIDKEAVAKDAKFDGFYACCTSISADKMSAREVAKINHGRWEIEENFRIMKGDMKARPVYVYSHERIKAHFNICFIALLVLRILEKQINALSDRTITVDAILTALKEMRIGAISNGFYSGSFKPTEVTELLQVNSGMRFNYIVLREKQLKDMLKQSKKIF